MLEIRMLRNVVTEDEENCSDILISGTSGEPLTSSNAASNRVDVRPTSQRRAVSPAALFSAAPTAADDDFLNFLHDHIFFINIFVL